MIGRSPRWRDWFPPPLVAIALLLLVLIGLTPELLPSATPPAGSLQTEAQLIVDRLSDGNVTHFYVRGIGTVRYATVSFAVDAHPPSSPPTWANFSFARATVWNSTIQAVFNSSSNPVALNVSADYVDSSGASVIYSGVFEFTVSGGTLTIASYALGAGGGPSTSAVPIDDLPVSVLLTVGAVGGGR